MPESASLRGLGHFHFARGALSLQNVQACEKSFEGAPRTRPGATWAIGAQF